MKAKFKKKERKYQLGSGMLAGQRFKSKNERKEYLGCLCWPK